MPRNESQHLGSELAQIKRAIKDLQSGRLQNASMHGSRLYIYDDEGDLREVIGNQGDGSYGSRVVQSPPQPTPTAPIVEVADSAAVQVTWDGGIVQGSMPVVHGHTQVEHQYLGPDGEVNPDAWVLAGSIRDPDGGTTAITCAQPGRWAICLRMRGADRTTYGDRSEHAEIVSPELVDSQQIRDEIDSISDRVGEGLEQSLTAALTSTMADLQHFRDEWDDAGWDADAFGNLVDRQASFERDAQEMIDRAETRIQSLAVTGSSGNLFSDPRFETFPDPGGYWWVQGSGGTWLTRSAGGAPALAVNLPSGVTLSGDARAEFFTNQAAGVPAQEGEEYVFRCEIWPSNIRMGQRVALRFRDQRMGTERRVVSGPVIFGGGRQDYEVRATAPEGATEVSVDFIVDPGSVGQGFANFLSPRLIRQIDGEAVIDGTLKARHVDMVDFTASQGFLDHAMVNLIQGRLANFDEALIGNVLIRDGAITPSKLLVGDTTDLVLDPHFTEGWWSISAPLTPVNEAWRNGSSGRSGVVTGTGEINSPLFKAIPGNKYVLTFKTERFGSASGDDYFVRIAGVNDSGGWVRRVGDIREVFAAAATRTITLEFEIPDHPDLTQWHVQWRFSALTSDRVRIGTPSLRRQVGGVLIEPEGVKAPQIDVNDLAAATARMEVLWAGVGNLLETNTDLLQANNAFIRALSTSALSLEAEGLGKYTRVSGQGLQVFDAETDVPQIQLGTFTDDLISLNDSETGDPVITMTQDGGVASQALSVASDPSFGGKRLAGDLYESPRWHAADSALGAIGQGVIAQGLRIFNSDTSTADSTAVFHLEATSLTPGRLYRIRCHRFMMADSAPVFMDAYYTTSTSLSTRPDQPTSSSIHLGRQSGSQLGGSTTLEFESYYPALTARRLRVLFAVGRYGGGRFTFGNAQRHYARFTIEDVGPMHGSQGTSLWRTPTSTANVAEPPGLLRQTYGVTQTATYTLNTSTGVATRQYVNGEPRFGYWASTGHYYLTVVQYQPWNQLGAPVAVSVNIRSGQWVSNRGNVIQNSLPSFTGTPASFNTSQLTRLPDQHNVSSAQIRSSTLTKEQELLLADRTSASIVLGWTGWSTGVSGYHASGVFSPSGVTAALSTDVSDQTTGEGSE